jgi:LacI family transcriptional regulator
MQFLGQSGYRVGQEVAVTGFDDIPTSALLTPALTSVHQPLDEVGDRVVGLLLEMLRGTPPRERHHLLQPRLIVRASSEGGPA